MFKKIFKKSEQKLCDACKQGKVEKVQRLLQNSKININWEDPDGWIAFHLACFKGHIDIVKLLLSDNRADVNKGNQFGWTPLQIAIVQGYIGVVELLLNDQRVDINQVENNGATPFHLACSNGHINIVKLLLNDQRVDINQVDKYEETSFYAACEYGHVEIVKLLLKDKRVDINQANKYSATPFWIANDKGHTEVVNVLRNESNLSFFFYFLKNEYFQFFNSFILESKLNFKEELERYNQNLQQNKDIINSIGNIRDILLYFSEDITLEMKQESIQNFVLAFKNSQDDQKRTFFSIIEKLSLNDEIIRIFKDISGMEILANSLVQSTKGIQEI